MKVQRDKVRDSSKVGVNDDMVGRRLFKDW